MFAIQLLHKSGGSKSVKAVTIQAVKDAAKAYSERFASSYVAATIPYAVYVVNGMLNTYDVSLPDEIVQGLGIALRILYQEDGGVEECKGAASRCMASRNYVQAAILWRRIGVEYMAEFCESYAVYHASVEVANKPNHKPVFPSLLHRYGVAPGQFQ